MTNNAFFWWVVLFYLSQEMSTHIRDVWEGEEMYHIEQCNLHSLHNFFFLDDNLFHVLYKIHYIVNKNNDHPFPLNNGNKGKKAKTQNT
jgi:hypothetical protein